MYHHYFSYFSRLPVPDNLCNDSAIRHPLFWRSRFLKLFLPYIVYGHRGHLGQWTATILAIFHSPAPRRLQMNFEQHWPRGSRGGCLKFWTVFQYKCIGKQTWPCREKSSQCTTIILATLVDLPRSWWYMQRFSHKASSVLEKIFKGFYHIWAWWPSWSMDGNHFSNLSFPCPREAPNENGAKLAQGLQRRSHLKMLTDGWTDEKWSL